MTTPAAKKPVRRATSVSQRLQTRQMDLSPGDTLEYGLSASTRTKRGGEVWVKAGATTTIRDGETAVEAKTRLRKAVEHMMDEAVQEVTG